MPAKRHTAPAEDPATAYARSVLSGETPAGKLVKLACQRHLNDLGRQGSDAFPFVWEPLKGAIFAQFCSLLRHYKGRFKNQPFELAPFQLFIGGLLFGWVHKDTGLRRFRTAVIRVPRKNGKTAFAAALALFLLSMDGEAGAEVYFAATKRDQAKLGWSDACRFLKYCPRSMKARFVERQNILEFPSADGKLVPLSGDSDTQDGLNPHAAICDEVHQWTDRSLWDALEDGMGAREQPVMVDISTAGTDTSTFAYETHKRGEDILDGTLIDESFLVYIAMADPEDLADYANPAVWEKANPALGTVKSYDYMAQQIKVVEATPSKLTTFLTKQLNIWANADERWLDPNDWIAGNHAGLAEKLLGRKCHGALDLAKVSDLSAFALVFRPDEVFQATGIKGKYALLAWAWCPGDDITKRSREHRVPYDAWERSGWITKTPGNVTDFGILRAGVEALCQKYQVTDIAFDRWGSQETVQHMQEAGLAVFAFGQGFKDMSPPTSEMERLVKGGNLLHEDNPLLAWCAGNVTCEIDPTGAIKPNKKKSREKIDPIVSAVMALGRTLAVDAVVAAPTVWVA